MAIYFKVHFYSYEEIKQKKKMRYMKTHVHVQIHHHDMDIHNQIWSVPFFTNKEMCQPSEFQLCSVISLLRYTEK